MLNRQPLPPLYAAAGLAGPVLARPASRRLPSATRLGAGADPAPVFSATLLAAAGATAIPRPVNPNVSSGDGSGGDSEGPPNDRSGKKGDRPEDRAQDQAAGSPAEDASPADEAEAQGADVAAQVAPEGSTDAGADAAAGVADPPDLSGYGAYGQVPSPIATLSRDELVARYAHLVKYVVGRLGVSVPGLFDHEDAMQAGVLGLLRAIDAYRPDAAASFESYAILRIRGAILDAVRSLDTVGRAGREAARAIQGAIRDLQHELGRSPTEIEIAGRLNMPVARYRERLQAASVVTVSLDEHDARDNDDESVVLADNAPDPNAVDPADEAARRDAIAGLVKEIGRLGERPKIVLALYYQDEMTFKEIGQVLGVTESRVCQIHTEAILALRTRLVDSDVAARLGRRRARS
jgi:RNA polymerase sigma factor FliA